MRARAHTTSVIVMTIPGKFQIPRLESMTILCKFQITEQKCVNSSPPPRIHDILMWCPPPQNCCQWPRNTQFTDLARNFNQRPAEILRQKPQDRSLMGDKMLRPLAVESMPQVTPHGCYETTPPHISKTAPKMAGPGKETTTPNSK